MYHEGFESSQRDRDHHQTGTIDDGEEDEEMSEGEVDAMPSALLPVGLKEATPKKDDTQC